jgi:DNA-binding NarL/FixJ family response regulator
MRPMTSSDKYRVLIADDAPEMMRRLADALSGLPHLEIVGAASDGDEALRLFAGENPDVAVIDLQMPGTNGLEVVRAIRRSNSNTLVIVLTMHDSPQLQTRCLEAGADYFLSKRTGFERIPEILGDIDAARARASP